MLRMKLEWRIAAAIASLVVAIVLTITVGFGWSFIFWIIFIVFVVGYFLLGTIAAASEKLNVGDLDGAERILGYTKFPNLLLKMNQAYFSLLKGMIALQRNDTKTGEVLLQEAYDKGLPTNNDKAMVLLNLAHINYSKNKVNLVKGQLRQIKELNVEDPSLNAKVAELEQALKSRPSGMQGMMYKGMGGRSKQRMVRPTETPKKSSNNRKSSSKRKKKKR